MCCAAILRDGELVPHPQGTRKGRYLDEDPGPLPPATFSCLAKPPSRTSRKIGGRSDRSRIKFTHLSTEDDPVKLAPEDTKEEDGSGQFQPSLTRGQPNEGPRTQVHQRRGTRLLVRAGGQPGALQERGGGLLQRLRMARARGNHRQLQEERRSHSR